MSHHPIDDLNNQTAVITGANGSIAQATAKRLSMRGARIIGIVRQNQEQAQQFLNTLGPDNLALQADVTKNDQVQQAVQQIEHCDILVNAAGSSVFVPHAHVALLTDELFDSMLINNLRSVYTVIRNFLPLLQKSSQGLIVNIGSTAAHVGGSNMAYAAAKAGVDSLTRNLSRAIAPVRIISISPGGVENDFVKNRSQDLLANAANTTPLARLATPDDVAATIEAYATLIRFVTGVTVTVDGGRTL
jgi:3-oxoacyl-[acyl-carrier protein] reductase